MSEQWRPVAPIVGARLREVREQKGLSMREVSRLVAELGYTLDHTAVSRLETGDRGISVDDLLALSLALGVEVPILMSPPGDIQARAVARATRIYHDTVRRSRAIRQKALAEEQRAVDELHSIVGDDPGRREIYEAEMRRCRLEFASSTVAS